MEGFRDKQVLVTGGLGFIGSNLAIELVRLGARVTIVDNMLPRQGGNLFNIREIEDRVRVNFSDVRNQLSMNHLVKGKDYVFHLAGQVNHVDSMRNPIQDLDINCRGTLVLLEALKANNRAARVIFAGTRGEYGASVKLPVAEDHPTNPKGIYAVTNLTAEKMVLVYDDIFGIKGTCLRITNTYGPRHQMAHDEYGVFNWFIRKALDGEVVPVFGDGRILRDFLYVEDLVECLLMSGGTESGLRRGLQRRRRRARLLPRACENDRRGRGLGQGRLHRVHAGAERGGAGRLLRGHIEDQAGRRLGAQDGPRGGHPQDRRFLQISTGRSTGGDGQDLRSGEGIRGLRSEALAGVIDRVCRGGEFILGKEVEPPSRRPSPDTRGSISPSGVGSGTDAIRIGGPGPGPEGGRQDRDHAQHVHRDGHGPLHPRHHPRLLRHRPGRHAPWTRPRLEEVLKATKGVKVCIPVHLYGHPCRMDEIMDVCGRFGVKVFEDACQAHGALYKGRKVGTFGAAAAFSFYPTKNLGAYGDAGGLVTADRAVYDAMCRLRNLRPEGKARPCHRGVQLAPRRAAGRNPLRTSCARLDAANERRRHLADIYRMDLEDDRARRAARREALGAPRLPSLRHKVRASGTPLSAYLKSTRHRQPRPLPHADTSPGGLPAPRLQERRVPGGGEGRSGDTLTAALPGPQGRGGRLRLRRP